MCVFRIPQTSDRNNNVVCTENSKEEITNTKTKQPSAEDTCLAEEKPKGETT